MPSAEMVKTDEHVGAIRDLISRRRARNGRQFMNFARHGGRSSMSRPNPFQIRNPRLDKRRRILAGLVMCRCLGECASDDKVRDQSLRR